MKKNSKIIDRIAEKTSKGFSAYSESYPIFRIVKELNELLLNAFEAVSMYFDKEKLKINLIHS